MRAAEILAMPDGAKETDMLGQLRLQLTNYYCCGQPGKAAR